MFASVSVGRRATGEKVFLRVQRLYTDESNLSISLSILDWAAVAIFEF